MMASTAYPDPTSSQMDANGSGLYLSGRPDSRQSQHTDQVQQALAASEQMEIPSPHELDPVQQHNFAQATPPQMVAQQAIDLNNHPANAYVTPSHDGIARDQRKRSKVSRACDECRRKKIRCDAAGAEEVSSCSSCRKSNRVCSYSRQPQKRGPSKGYIKELADRVKVLESLSDVHRSPTQRDGSASLHASLGALQGLTAALGGSVSTGSKRNYSMMSNASPGADHSGAFDGDVTVYFNENTERYRQQLDIYYENIQPSIPLLPTNKDEILARLTATQCQSLPEALLQAVECVNSMLIPNLALQNQHAAETLEANARGSLQRAEWELEMVSAGANMSILLSDQILYVISMLLIVIYQDMRPDPYGSRTVKADYLGRSATRLALLKENDAIRHDGENTLALFNRISGVLFIIDRYSAIGNFGEFVLPLDCSELLAQYSLVVDEEPYELARIAELLAFIGTASKAVAPETNSSNFLATILASHPINVLFKSSLDRIRLAAIKLPLSEQSPMRSAIFHAQLLLARLSPVASGAELLRITKELINSLQGYNHLTHHFAALAASSLLDLVRNSDINRDEAGRVIDLFMNALSNGQIFRIDDTNGHQWINNLLGALTAAKGHLGQANGDVSGLRNLAEAAVTEREAGEASVENGDSLTADAIAAQANAAVESLKQHDPTRLIQAGYMTAFH